MFFFVPYKVLIGKPEGKRRLGRPRRRGDDNIKTHLKERGWESFEWFQRAQDRGPMTGCCDHSNEKFYISLTVHHVMNLGK
jgi:hypothetical protein